MKPRIKRSLLLSILAIVITQIDITARHGFGGGFAAGAFTGAALTGIGAAAASSTRDRDYVNLRDENYYLRSELEQIRQQNMEMQRQIDELQRRR